MNIYTTLVLIFLFTFSESIAQSETPQEKAHRICLDGVELLKTGKVQDALELFTEASELDPENYFYPYEIAHAHYLIRHYKTSLKMLEKLIQHKDVTENAFVLLGNSQDHLGHHKKAMETYLQGLEKFPNAGELYLELANVEMGRKKYESALVHYEKGIEVEPQLSSNYYWAAKVHASLDGKLWGILYGEAFLNLEPGSERSIEISKMIFDVYQKCLVVTPGKIETGFTTADLTETENISFEAAFEETMRQSVEGIKGEINIENLNKIRSNFINIWMNKAYNHRFPNIIFERQIQLVFQNKFEAYNYWLLWHGSEDEAAVWQKKNLANHEELIHWLPDNLIHTDRNNLLIKNQYNLK